MREKTSLNDKHTIELHPLLMYVPWYSQNERLDYF